MKTPTREELDAIPVSDEEEREYLHKRAQIRLALYLADIPSTLEWALVMVDAATQVLVIQGMPRGFYLELATSQFAHSASKPRRPRPPSAAALAGLRSTDVKRVQQLFDALRAHKLDVAGDSAVAPHLIGLAADVLADNAVTPQMFCQLCAYAYELAEKRVTAMGKAHQA
jgi:hypothetical protein